MPAITIKLKDGMQIVPDQTLAAEAAARAVENCVIDHLRNRNSSTAPNRFGLPKSNYYAEAADTVTSSSSGKHARVEIDYPGIALHYFGGTVYPKKKALAVPVDPRVASIWPSEYEGQGHKLFKTPGGALGDAETGEILWILLAKATIPADPDVLPTEDNVRTEIESAIWELVS